VLFLKYIKDGDDFSILTGYELRSGHVVPLDDVEGLFNRYKDSSEADFLGAVRAAIQGAA
jgi:hypothetical protein